MMGRQPEDLRRLLEDPEGIEAGAERLAGRRVFVVGTGTSWHAANLGAYFLRRARVDALAVSAADCAEWGPRPTPADGLVLLSHRGTKRYTREVLERARATVFRRSPSAVRAHRVPISRPSHRRRRAHSPRATWERSAGSPSSPQALGAELGELEAVPAAVAAALDGPSPAVELPERGLEFVGAGPNQWTAAEGSLKVRESAHVFAEGLAVEQLLHGPGFALDGRDALVSLDGGGPGAPRLAELVNAIESRGTRVYRFSARSSGSRSRCSHSPSSCSASRSTSPSSSAPTPTTFGLRSGRRSTSRRAHGRPARILVLQHIACEPPGVFEDVLHERGAQLLRRSSSTRANRSPTGEASTRSSRWAARCRPTTRPSCPGSRREAADRRRGASRNAVLGRVPRRPAARSLARGARVPRAGARGRTPPGELTPEARSDPVFGEAPTTS